MYKYSVYVVCIYNKGLSVLYTYSVANEKKNSPKPRQVTNPNILCFFDNDGQ